MKHIFAVVGETASGKDTICDYVVETLPYVTKVCSYSTAPKRPDQVEGVDHYFVTQDKMKDILKNEKVLAYVKFPKTNYEYCSTVESLRSNYVLYIIDPNGLNSLYDYIKQVSEVIYIHIIYIDTFKDVRINRAKSRKNFNLLNRINSEESIFNKFKRANRFDLHLYNCIDNSVLPAETFIQYIENIYDIDNQLPNWEDQC